MVRNINATGSSWPNGMRTNSWTPRTFAQYNGRIYFMADDGVHGVEPWTSDGTAAGTVMVADIAPGSASAFTNTENAWLTTAGNKMMFNATDGITGQEPWAVSGLPKMMAGNELPVPSGLELEQNYPNPFNPSTTIAFGLPQSSHARLRVYDAHGRIVATLVEGDLPAGRHEVAFDASSLPSGMYMYRLDADGRTRMNKMSLVK
jgi:ELWxxDGT repeat protein